MADRKFGLTLNTQLEDERELHSQFRHYLEHVVKVCFIPETKGKNLLVSGRDGESKEQIFGGPGGKFLNLYHIEEIHEF